MAAVWAVVLPPYSPNFNPIKFSFSVFKAWFQHTFGPARTTEDLEITLFGRLAEIVLFESSSITQNRQENSYDK